MRAQLSVGLIIGEMRQRAAGDGCAHWSIACRRF
jgi:hypothetical protein